MKYFSDVDGLICWVDEDGSSNHPSIANNQQPIKIEDQKILFLSKDGTVKGEYVLWNNLTALAVAIDKPVHLLPDEPMHIDNAVALAHQAIEEFRSDWHQGNLNHPDNYPLTIESNNSGVLFEQMASAITST
ncbi:hypothetical protein AMD27_17200 (plasmid) [Acinetobacter sp. TGL-Y2]|uniref:hypothetical protein n=1 Tax=Acinetobacter sp. TGL-Y2 TaxID=1407071 RepID=UPI0007A67045|nr:hypothetical protein [Acinetobacter sp. TGL-Y2]AMW80654.1 hypothetical protein AMD27_17200 [Acinetobacter sp. TGL-Y2]